jgi:hypothetical protein
MTFAPIRCSLTMSVGVNNHDVVDRRRFRRVSIVAAQQVSVRQRLIFQQGKTFLVLKDSREQEYYQYTEEIVPRVTTHSVALLLTKTACRNKKPTGIR